MGRFVERMTLSNWIASHYFVKCAHCGYEIFIGSRHTAPRECPKCSCKMTKVIDEKSIIKINLREALRIGSELYTPKYCCVNRLEEK